MPSPGISLQFERSYSNSIYSHYVSGPLGQGWTIPWQTNLVNEDNGAFVQIVNPDGTGRSFQRDSRDGSYFSGTGDSSTLVDVGGGYFDLRTVSGSITRFAPNGKIAYVIDTNSNRVTASYNSQGQLFRLEHSSGATLGITYRQGGLISTVTDLAGRVTTYVYDSTNTYLTAVTTDDKKQTTYTYNTAGPLQTLHALKSITRAGVTQTIAYDTRGRIETTYFANHQQLVHYTYNETGLVTVDDDTTTAAAVSLYFDYHGQLAKLMDPLGNISTNEFDANLRLSRTVAPTGESLSFTWCNCGGLTSVTNELGNKTTFTYDFINNSYFKRLTSSTDAIGNTTEYHYDTAGNLLQTVGPDGTATRLSEYVSGLPQQSTNRRGQPVRYSYNAYGQVTSETFADNTSIKFDYDSRGNLNKVADGNSITVYSYEFAKDGDRLKRIESQDGRFLEFTYDGFGRRTQMIDQNGFATKYDYDSVGRISQLKDSSNHILVKYSYYDSGRLLRVDKANGRTHSTVIMRTEDYLVFRTGKVDQCLIASSITLMTAADAAPV